MKYIRTKDGRVFYAKKKNKKDVKFANDNLHWEAIPKGCYDYFTLDYTDDEIVKVADTIEELCDGFIIGETLKIYNKSNFNFEKKIVNLGHKEYYKFENLKSIYGVIMIFENGIPRIITVAKMNELGELELL